MAGSEDLEELAKVRFAPLSKSESNMLQAAARGTTAFCGPSQQDDDPGNDPVDSDNWSADRQIRSDLIRWLCIDKAAKDCLDPRGVQLHGARINGALDLSFATVHFPLRLSRCRLSDDWNLNYIDIPSIELTGTWVRSLTADVAKIRGSFILKEFCAKGKVQLRGSQIGGDLDCGGGRFQNAEIPGDGVALNADGAKVGGYVFLNNNFSAEGEVRLLNADITSDLDCEGGTFKNPVNAEIPGSGMALNAEGAKVGGYVFLRNNFSAEGEVRLFNADVGSDLDCEGSKFQNPANADIPGSGVALNAEGAKVGGYVFLRNNFSAVGEIRLFNSDVGSDLDCSDSKFQNPANADIPGSGMALNAGGAKIGGHVFLRNFSAEGEVRLFIADVAGNLECDGSTFQNPVNAKIPGSGMALNAGGAKFGGHVFLRNNFSAEGEVRLFNANVAGSIDCEGGKFQNAANAEIPGGGVALNAGGAKVGSHVFLRNNFSAEGEVRLFNADIAGSIDCEGGTFQNPAKAEIPGSGLALNAGGAKIGGSVFLRNNFSAAGEVRLFNADVAGTIDCVGGKFQNPTNAEIPGSGVALNAEGAKVGGYVFLRNNFSAEGEVRLFNADVAGNLECDGSTFQNPANAEIPDSGVALNAGGVKVGGSVFLRNNFSAEGEVRLFSANVAGNLECDGSTFKNPANADIPGGGVALNAEGSKVGGHVFLRNNFSAEGEVRLFIVDVAGNLECGASTFKNPANAEIPGSGLALNAGGAKVGGHVFLRNFSAEGEVQLIIANVAGNLECGGSTFQNPANAEIPGSGVALNAEGAKVGGHIFLSNNFSAEGEVRLFGAGIGQSLDCNSGTFQNPANAEIPNSVALTTEGATIGGSVFLNNYFSANGPVRLFGTEIGRSLDCSSGKFQNPANAQIPGSGVAIDARGISTGGSIFLSKEFSAVGTVNLANARITSSLKCEKAAFDHLDLTDAFAGSILDDEESWPTKGNLSLDGFVYGRISDGPLDASKRLTWLKRQSSFRRQPYRQLASILGNTGDDLGTRQVMSDMQREAWEQRGWLFRPISLLLRFTIGYGYFPLRAVWLILALVVVGSSIYWVAYNRGSIVPTQKESYAFFEAHCYAPNEYERFHTVPYSLENSFPLVKLGVQDKWAPAPEARVPACSSTDLTSPALRVISEPQFLRWFRWTQICLGWVLTTLFVGGVTGILRKN